VFVFSHGLFLGKLEPSIDRQHLGKLVVVDPDGALLRRRGHESDGHDFHAVRVEEMTVGHGGGARVVDVADFKLGSDFRLGG